MRFSFNPSNLQRVYFYWKQTLVTKCLHCSDIVCTGTVPSRLLLLLTLIILFLSYKLYFSWVLLYVSSPEKRKGNIKLQLDGYIAVKQRLLVARILSAAQHSPLSLGPHYLALHCAVCFYSKLARSLMRKMELAIDYDFFFRVDRHLKHN